jgi:hypothetical protein
MQQPTSPDLPPYVVAGEWRDEEWCAAFVKSETNGILTPAERCLLQDHPRPRTHPYGYGAWQREVANRKVMIFPSEEAHDAWIAQTHG